ncbi:MAG: ABC transporter ATP-binding protein/permease [Clostridia bacterium]|nr:ABC transporter ATP-binding protein/permease [Clostridia bacterium]
MPKPIREHRKAKNTKKALFDLAKYSKQHWWGMLLAMIFAIGSTVLAVLAPDKIARLTEIIQEGIVVEDAIPVGMAIDMTEFMTVIYTLIGMYAVSMVLNYLQHFIMTNVSCAITQNMRKDISCKINKVPLSYFDSHSFGDTLSRVTNDVDTVSQSFVNSVGNLITAVSMLVGCLIMMFITQWALALSTIGATLIGFVIISIIMVFSQKYFSARQKSLARVNGHVEEYFAGQNVVRAYNAESRAREEFSKRNAELKKNTFKAEFFGGMMQPLMGFVGNFGYVVVVIAGAALAFNGTFGVEFPVIVSFMIYVRQFSSPLGQMAQSMANLQSAAAASERVFEFLGETELSDESEKPLRLESVNGDVEFGHVKFGYTADRTIIHDFSAKIRAGQKIAIVGPTGAGKTTVVNLLMRFYELDGGEIKVDGVPLSEVTRENVHDLFGMVLQDTWLFEGTLRDNLTYGKKEITDSNLLQVCKATGLEHFVRTLPEGLDTVLNDAVAISAGQKQLITIARAMVENAPMLILDEATSSVDTRTEAQIQKAMNKLTEGRTSFVIAHRLSTIRDADMILYMQDGDIRETGTHEQLLAKNGLYAKLYNSQFEQAG